MTGKIITRDQIKDGRLYEVTLTGVGISKCVKAETVALGVTLEDPSCVIRDVTPPEPIKAGDVVRIVGLKTLYEVLKVVGKSAVLFSMENTGNWTTSKGDIGLLERVNTDDDPSND